MRLFFVFTLFIFFSGSAAAISSSTLPIDPFYPSLGKQMVELPFPYRQVKKDEFEFFHQGSAALLTPDSSSPLLATGPLKPCIGIFIQNKKNKRILGLHKHFTTQLQSLKNFLSDLEFTEDSDPNDLQVYIYSVEIEEESYNDRFRDLHEGRTQQEELIFVKKELIRLLQIKESQIIAEIWIDDEGLSGGYVSTESYLVVDRNFQFFHSSPVLDDLLDTGNDWHSKALVPDPQAVLVREWQKRKYLSIQAVRTGLKLSSSDPLPWTALGPTQSIYGIVPFFKNP